MEEGAGHGAFAESFCRLSLQGNGTAFTAQLMRVGVEFEEAEAEEAWWHGQAFRGYSRMTAGRMAKLEDRILREIQLR